MKILVLPSWYPPKGGTFFQEQAELLAAQGHDVHVISFNEYSLKEFSFKQNNVFSDKNVKVYEKKFWRIPKLKDANQMRFIRQYLRYAERMFKIIQPDIIHAHSVCWGGLIAQQINFTHKVPYIITEHRSRFVARNDAQKLIKDWHKPLITKAFKNAHRIICVSTPLAQGIQSAFKVKPKKTVVIPNVVLLYDQELEVKIEKDDKFKFIFVGNLEHYKGIHILVQALINLPKEIKTKISLNVLGKGSKMKELMTLVKEKNMQDVIHFQGFVPKEEVIQLMKQSDALISSSLYESFGVNIVEALYAGLPILATHSGGPEEIVNDGNGILVDCTEKAIGKGIVEMINKRSLFDSDLIKSDAFKKYLPEVVIPEIEQVLKQAINE